MPYKGTIKDIKILSKDDLLDPVTIKDCAKNYLDLSHTLIPLPPNTSELDALREAFKEALSNVIKEYKDKLALKDEEIASLKKTVINTKTLPVFSKSKNTVTEMTTLSDHPFALYKLCRHQIKVEKVDGILLDDPPLVVTKTFGCVPTGKMIVTAPDDVGLVVRFRDLEIVSTDHYEKTFTQKQVHDIVVKALSEIEGMLIPF